MSENNNPSSPSQEEGPAGVDLEAEFRAIEEFMKRAGLFGSEKIREHVRTRAERAIRRLRAQAPASSPRDLEAVRDILVSIRDADGDDIDEIAERCTRQAAEALAILNGPHPPKGETPSEAAGLTFEAWFASEQPVGTDDSYRRCWDAPRAPGTAGEEALRMRILAIIQSVETQGKHPDLASREVMRHVRAAAPGTAIEKAAREALAELEAACNIVERHGGEDVLIEYIRPRLARARASLSSLPQEGAAGEGGGA